jgi:hypothetical protein
MKSTTKIFWRVMTALILAALLLSTSCAPKINTNSVLTKEPANLKILKQYGNISARFYAIMTFTGLGATVDFPSELAIPPLSIEWMGNIFSGKLVGFGPGGEITYQVHGSVSDDGLWLDSLSYSREIIWGSANSGSFYRVTMQNLPIGSEFNGAVSNIGECEKTGSDIQRYLVKIEFAEGTLDGRKIISTTNYISTDWKNIGVGQTPSLSVKFAPGPGQQISTDIPTLRPPGMGMGR